MATECHVVPEPPDELHGRWGREAGPDSGARARPQTHGWNRKGQEKQRPETYLQGSSPSPPSPRAPGPLCHLTQRVGFLGPVRGLAFRPLPMVVPSAGSGGGDVW